MSEEKKKETKTKKDENEIDKELQQSFPASDPPSHSRPGYERTEDDDDEDDS